MYVIEVSGSTADAAIGKSTSNKVLIPAEQCTFTTQASAVNNNYVLSNVHIYDGVSNRRQLATGNDYQLGYIGKTGRFVAITD